jgi:superfamily II DNA or RNA helicase
MFSAFTQRAVNKGKRVLIMAHREELLDQISDTLGQFKVRHEFIAAGRRHFPEIPVQVASVFSAVRRLNKIHTPDLIICDEAHHLAPGSSWWKVFAHFSKAWRIGVTASPARLSGEPLGYAFDHMILGPSVTELINMGMLSKYKLYAPSTISTEGLHMLGGDFNQQELAGAADKPSITGDAIKHYSRLAAGKRAVVFCVSIEHAKHVQKQFSDAGISAGMIDGKMDKPTRRGIVNSFRSGQTLILVSVGIISEGFDLPAIECAIMLRPTASLACWIQQSGRALRIFPGKEYAIILDHAGNCARHGLPDDDREWSLEGRPKRKGEYKPGVTVRICPKCFACMASTKTECQYCGFEFPVEGRKVEEKEGELVEVDPAVLRRQRMKEQSKAQTYEELVEIGKKRQYKNPYAWARILVQIRKQRGQ